jgi:hypothetical protein
MAKIKAKVTSMPVQQMNQLTNENLQKLDGQSMLGSNIDDAASHAPKSVRSVTTAYAV